MPSERSKASEMTGLNAARTKARSISLQTCCSPLSMTARVTGSRLRIVRTSLVLQAVNTPSTDWGRGRAAGCAGSCGALDADDEVAEPVDRDGVAGLDHRRGVELLEDRGAAELGAERQQVAGVDRRLPP